MKGSLTGFTLEEIFEMVAHKQKTGLLEVAGKSLESQVYFREGLLYWAAGSEAEGGAGSKIPVKERIEETVMEMFEKKPESYRFEADETTEKGGEITYSVNSILADVAKRQAEWAKIRKEIPSLRARVSLIGKIEGDGVTLTSRQWEIIAHIGKHPTVEQLRDEVNTSSLAVCKTLYDMCKSGLIRCLDEPLKAEKPTSKKSVGDEKKKYIRKSLTLDEAGVDVLPAEWSSYYKLLDSKPPEIGVKRSGKVS